jgi:hypothetical protein
MRADLQQMGRPCHLPGRAVERDAQTTNLLTIPPWRGSDVPPRRSRATEAVCVSSLSEVSS